MKLLFYIVTLSLWICVGLTWSNYANGNSLSSLIFITIVALVQSISCYMELRTGE